MGGGGGGGISYMYIEHDNVYKHMAMYLDIFNQTQNIMYSLDQKTIS